MDKPLSIAAFSSSQHMMEEFLWNHSISLKHMSFPQLPGQEEQKIVLIFPGNTVTQLQVL